MRAFQLFIIFQGMASLSAEVLEVNRVHFDGDNAECLKSKSQGGEEDVIREVFAFDKLIGGTYVEIGALDGEDTQSKFAQRGRMQISSIITKFTWNRCTCDFALFFPF